MLSEKIEFPETKISFTCNEFHLAPPVPPISYVSLADGIRCFENLIAFSVVPEFQVTDVPEILGEYLEYVSSDIPLISPVTLEPLTLSDVTFTELKLASPFPIISIFPVYFYIIK